MSQMINGFFAGEITPDEIVGGCINIFENVWPNPSQTIDLLERECTKDDSDVYFARAETIGSGVYQDQRTNSNLALTHLAQVTSNPVLQNIHNQFNMLLLAATSNYVKRYEIQEGLWHEPYGVLRYNGGEEYKAHYDGGSDMGRCISALAYLNDDYTGGEIEFPNFNVKIKPQAGMLILFPSTFPYTHIAHPIIEGTKYAIVTWLRDQKL